MAGTQQNPGPLRPPSGRWLSLASVLAALLSLAFVRKSTSSKNSAKPGSRAPAWIVLAASLAVTVAALKFVGANADESLRERFHARVELIRQSLLSRAANYEIALQAGAGLLTVSQEVTAQEWDRFVRLLRIRESYPGLTTLGWVVAADPDDSSPVDRKTARGDAANAETISMLVRFAAAGQWPAAGVDLAAFPEYRQAAQQAAGSGRAVVSQSQRTSGDERLPAMFLPVYLPAGADAQGELRGPLHGWLVAWFRPAGLVKALPAPLISKIDLEVFGAAGTPDSGLLYDTDPQQRIAANGDAFVLLDQSPIEIGSRTWTLVIGAKPEFARSEQEAARSVFLAGLIASLILFVVTDSLANSRLRALAAAQLMTERLRQNEAYSRAIVENAPVGILTFTPDGVLETVNAAAERMFGYRGHEVVGFTFEELLAEPSGFRSKGYDGFAKFRKETGRRADGTPFPLELSIWPTHVGERRGYTAIAVDVAERLQAADALRSERDFSATVLNLAPALVVVMDLQGRIVVFNRACEQTTGYTFDEVKGRGFADLFVPAEERDIVRRVFGELCAGVQPVHYECHWITKRGERRLIASLNTGLLDAGGLRKYLIGCGEDVTEQREAERAAERYVVELEQAHSTTERQAEMLEKQAEDLASARDAALESARMKAQFLANMSHEIRTPMSGVLGMTHLLLDTALDEEQQDYAATIRNSAEALLVILNDILDFSKIEAGKLQFEALDFNLVNAFQSAVRLLSQQAESKGIVLKTTIAPEVPSWVRGDSGRLRQVLLNLTGNAVKFTEQGGVQITLELKSATSEQVELHFAIRDTGTGISPEVCKNLFRPFVQADGSTSRKYGGTGLGLAISEQLVHGMGGEIGCDSVLGQGSVFWFTVKLEKLDTRDIPHLTGLRILVVADHQVDRERIQCDLESWEMDWQSASSWKQALETLRQSESERAPFTAIVAQTSEVDRLLEFAADVRADPRCAETPILVWGRERWTSHRGSLRELGVEVGQHVEAGSSDLFNLLAGVASSEAWSAPAPHSEEAASAQVGARPTAGASRRVLLVEDNLVNQKVAQRMLRNLGCDAEIAGNGREALAALESASYDLILMDCQMPEMDGYQATAEIRQRENGKSRVPIVALTAHAMQGARERCLEAGMDDYLSKPINPEALKSTLSRWGLPPLERGPETVEAADRVR